MNEADQDRIAIPATHVEQDSSHAPMGAKKAKRLDSRVSITIISYRKRKHDPDGISAKAAIDGIVRAGLLRDDSTEEIKSVTFESRKCAKDEEEKTVIVIE